MHEHKWESEGFAHPTNMQSTKEGYYAWGMDGATQNCPTYPFMFGVDLASMDINLMSSKYRGYKSW